MKSSGMLQTAWSEVLAGPRAIGDPELLKKTADEKWPAFQEAHDYSNRELREEIVPLYRKMVDIFTEKMWLAEPSTLIYFGVLVEYVEIWNRALAGAIPNDAMILYNHDEDKVKPLYADLVSHVQRLSGELQRTKTTRTLDLKRGLNRLYLVFAVIWILGGFLYAYRTEKAAQQVACASLTSQGVTRLPSTVNPPQQPPDGVRAQGPDGQMYFFPDGDYKAGCHQLF